MSIPFLKSIVLSDTPFVLFRFPFFHRFNPRYKSLFPQSLQRKLSRCAHDFELTTFLYRKTLDPLLVVSFPFIVLVSRIRAEPESYEHLLFFRSPGSLSRSSSFPSSTLPTPTRRRSKHLMSILNRKVRFGSRFDDRPTFTPSLDPIHIKRSNVV